MKTKFNPPIRAICNFSGGVICAGAAILISSSAQAQNLFAGNAWANSILEFTPGGAQSTFASGSSWAEGLAFNSAGDLFASFPGNGNIVKFTPGGAQSTFASGLSFPAGLALNSAGDLFAADVSGGNIYKFTPG